MQRTRKMLMVSIYHLDLHLDSMQSITTSNQISAMNVFHGANSFKRSRCQIIFTVFITVMIDHLFYY